jgi:hypothetical protein
MAEFLVLAKNKWMDALTQQEIDDRATQSDHFLDKYYARERRGDIIQVRENGYWIGRMGWGFPKFVVIQVTNLNMEQGAKYADRWNRSVNIVRITNDEQNHIYEYRISLNRLSTIHDDELFNAVRDKLDELPKDVSVVSKSTTEVVLRLLPLTHPNVISGLRTPIERRDRVEAEGKLITQNFRKTIRNRRYAVLVDNLPQVAKDLLQSQGWVSYTKAQVASYLKDKVL